MGLKTATTSSTAYQMARPRTTSRIWRVFPFLVRIFDQQAAGHQIDPLPEGVATEIEEARTIVRQCRLSIERTVVFHMVHVDVLHAIEAGNARGQQRENIFEIELERFEEQLDARAGSNLGREYARV